jgi:hypothetical protein
LRLAGGSAIVGATGSDPVIQLSPSDVAVVRAAGRTWLVAPQVFPPVLRFLAARQPPLRARRLDGAADRQSIRRLHARLEARPRGEWRSDAHIAAWLDRGLERGRLAAFDVTVDDQLDPSELSRRQDVPLNIPGGLPSGLSFPRPAIDHLSRDALRERCAEVLMRAPLKMDDEPLRRDFDALIIPDAFEQAVTAMTRWAGELHDALRPAFDRRVLARAWGLVGWPAFDGLAALGLCLTATAEALVDDDFDVAAGHLAQALAALEIAPFIMITAQETDLAEPQPPDFDAAVLRWQDYIEGLEVSPDDARRGALWGALGLGSQLRALDLARRGDRATLADVLAKTDFLQRYRAEFGARANTPLSRRVWDLVSERYARALLGRVTLYVEGSGAAPTPTLTPAPGTAASSSSGGTGQDLKTWMARTTLGQDAMSLRRVLSPAVTDIEVVDIGGPATPLRLPAVDLRR